MNHRIVRILTIGDEKKSPSISFFHVEMSTFFKKEYHLVGLYIE